MNIASFYTELKYKKENNIPLGPSYHNGEDGGFCYRPLNGPDIPPLEPLPEEDIPFCMDATETSSE